MLFWFERGRKATSSTLSGTFLNHNFDASPLVVKKMDVTELLCCARRLCLLFCRFMFSVLQKRHGKSILYMYSFHRSIFKNFVQSRSTESNSFVDSWAWQEILEAAAAETGKSHTAETFLLPVTFFLSPRFLSLGN